MFNINIDDLVAEKIRREQLEKERDDNRPFLTIDDYEYEINNNRLENEEEPKRVIVIDL